jgi:hypothetical protein
MRKIIFYLGFLGSIVLLLLAGKVFTSQAISMPHFPASSEATSRKIVVFKPEITNDQEREALIQRFGGVKLKDLNLINGKAVLYRQLQLKP